MTVPPIHPELPDAHAIRTAVVAMRPEDEPAWGRMTAPQMLEHLARFHEVYLGRVPVPGLMRFLARLVGGPFVRKFLATSPWEMKRGMGTMPQLRMDRVLVDEDQFDTVRSRVLATFDEIHAKTGSWDHPLYGSIDARTGQALARHHAAHHLHQFGKLGPDPE